MVQIVPRPRLDLPESLYRLDELGTNLWWSWHPRAAWLFRSLDPVLWETLDQNPVMFLRYLNPERLRRAAADPAYVTAYDAVMDRFDALTQDNATTAWVGRHEPALVGRPVAYFSAEFGLHPSLPIYSGGLGVLAGDHIKTASDLGLPLFAVSLLYRQGYLRQRLDADGWQLDVPAELEPWGEPTTPMLAPDGRPRLVEVAFEDPAHPVRLAVWVVQVGRVPSSCSTPTSRATRLDADDLVAPLRRRQGAPPAAGDHPRHRRRPSAARRRPRPRLLARQRGPRRLSTSWSGSASTSPPGCPSPRPPSASGGRRSSPATPPSRPATTSSRPSRWTATSATSGPSSASAGRSSWRSAGTTAAATAST
jgi:hypothetical protein